MNLRIKLIAVGFILLVIVFSSCSFEKRLYRKGFYISNHHSSDKKNNTVATSGKQTALKTETTNNTGASIIESENALANSAKENTLSKKTTQRKTLFTKDDCGDLMTLRNGEELKVKVIEISEREIKYKRCDNLDGPLITISKNDVFMIKYPNGTKEVFKEGPKQNNTQQKQNPDPKPLPPNGPIVHPMAVASLVAGLLWIYFVGSVMAIIMGAKALRKINEQPDRYKGKGLAIAGIILGALEIIILALVIYAIAALGI